MNITSFTILLIADEIRTLRLLRTPLLDQGFRLEEARTGPEGLLKALMQKPDVIILDLELPHSDGLEITRQLHTLTDIPIMVISGHESEAHKIAALDAGADDYLIKPLRTGECMARLRAILRRTLRMLGTKDDLVFHIGELRIDLARHQVWVGEREIRLTPTEYKLLIVLAQHAGRVLTYRQLLSTVWGPDHAQANHYLRVYMGVLRRKLEADAAHPRYLHTETAVGYRLAVEKETGHH